jgi:hypothetical protein
VAADPECSTPLIQNDAIGRDSEPVPSTSHPHNLFPQDLTNSLAAEPEGSTTLAVGQDFGPVPSTGPFPNFVTFEVRTLVTLCNLAV